MAPSDARKKELLEAETARWREGLGHALEYHARHGDFRYFCSRPWYDPKAAADVKLTTYPSPPVPVEVDTFEALKLTQTEAAFHRWNEFVVFQHWGDWAVMDDETLGRPYMALTVERARAVAEILKGGPTRRLIFIVTMFMRGALRAFADALGPEQLELLGLFWWFSGDDITDEAENAGDVAYAAKVLGLKRASILTGAFNDGVERDLAAALAGNERLVECQVFRKTEDHLWPRIPTPLVERALEGNRGLLGFARGLTKRLGY